MKARKVVSRIIDCILFWLPLVLFIIIWHFTVQGSETRIFLFASPFLVIKALWDGISSGLLIKDIWVTSLETLSGFLLGNIIGSIIGLLLWCSNKIARISRPYIVAIGSVPIFAIAPMMIIWFGTGISAKIIMAALSTVVIAIVQAYEGAKQVDSDRIRLLKSFGATKLVIFKKLIIPSALIWVISSYKLNISFALLGAFIGEFVSSEYGLGHRILQAGGLYNVPLAIAGILCIIFLALSMSWILGIIERKLFSWKDIS